VLDFLSVDTVYYQPLRLIHILSSTLLFGTGLGTAFHGLAAFITKDPRVIARVGRSVVWADWLFTTPAVIIQPVTGLMLVELGGHQLFDGWVLWAIALYIFTGACWLPVVWLQIRIRQIAEVSLQNNTSLPPLAFRYMRMWFALGWPAFAAVLGIFYLMVFRPAI
jgi:uncharacterized membrane protein